MCIFGKLNGYISSSALPPDCNLQIKMTTDNHIQLRAEVSIAGSQVADGGHGPLEGLYRVILGYRDKQVTPALVQEKYIQL